MGIAFPKGVIPCSNIPCRFHINFDILDK